MEIEKVQFFHKVPVQIRFNDIDSLGHVNNAIIQEYFDLGRMEYFKTVFSKSIEWKKFAAIIASIKTDFALPVFINDNLQLKTKITQIGTKSMNLVQHLTDEAGNTKAVCHSVMVGFDHKTQSSIEVSSEWRKQISNLEKDCQF